MTVKLFKCVFWNKASLLTMWEGIVYAAINRYKRCNPGHTYLKISYLEIKWAYFQVEAFRIQDAL